VGRAEDILRSTEWKYGDQDPVARAELKSRIETRVRSDSTITYSKLADGVPFRLAEFNNGEPYYLDFMERHGIDSTILGSFLGRIDADTYREAGFFITAFVVLGATGLPSYSFFESAKDLNLIPDLGEDTKLRFWTEQMRLAKEYYSKNR